MTQFYLKLRCGDEPLPNDPEPQEFMTIEEARKEAAQSLREIAADSVRHGQPFDYNGIDITDLEGKVLLHVSTSEVLRDTK
jgi:hypothetical protein